MLFARISFYPTLCYNIILEKISNRRWFDRIDETVILGALPWRTITPKLINEENVRGVISMNEDFELKFGVTTQKEWHQLGVKFLQLNTPDIFHVPSEEKVNKGISFIKEFQMKGQSVYVHCKAGRTRSAILVGFYLMNRHNWTPETAVNFIKTKRPHILLRSKQWVALNKYYEKMNIQKSETNTKLDN